jgi:hypothetical protein
MRFTHLAAFCLVSGLGAGLSFGADPSSNKQEAPAEAAPAKEKESKPFQEPKKNTGPVVIGKIYDFLNDPDVTPTGGNEPLEYEFKYFNYGAVTEDQKKARLGHYYVVNFENSGPQEDLILRFEYRQEKTREKIHVFEIPFPAVKGSRKGNFKVIGNDYLTNGRVISWRASVVRQNGEVLDERTSFVW